MKNQLFAILTTLLSSGCADALETSCNECPTGHNVYHCGVSGFGNNRICALDDVHAAGLCPEGAALVSECSDYGTGGVADGGSEDEGDGDDNAEQYPDWDPSLYIRKDTATGTYLVDGALIEEVAADPYVLIAKDSARLTELPNGFFRFSRVASGDLAYLLGLRTGDVVKRVNSRPLRTLDDCLNAAAALRTAKRLSLAVERRGTTKLLEYRIE